MILNGSMTTDQKGNSCSTYARGSAYVSMDNTGKATPGVVTVYGVRGGTRIACTNESILLKRGKSYC